MPLIDCQIISTGQRVGFLDTSNKKITLYMKQHEKMCRKKVSEIVLIFCLRQLSLLKDVQHFWCKNWVQFWIDEIYTGYTWVWIPISPLFGTFLAHFCQVFLQNIQNSEEKQKQKLSKVCQILLSFQICAKTLARKCWKSAKCKISAQKWQNTNFLVFSGKISVK